MNEDLMQQIRQFDINMLKGPPSATEAQQSADASTEFCNIKQGVAMVARNETNVFNNLLRSQLASEFWPLLGSKLHEHGKEAPTAEFKEKANHGLETIVYVMTNKGYCTSGQVKDAFYRTGQNVRNPDDLSGRNPVLGFEKATLDADIILGKCYKGLGEETTQFLKEHMPELIPIARLNGKFSKKDFEDIGIIDRLEAEGHVMVDRWDNVLWQQHACILSHESIGRAYSEYKHGRDPANIAEAKVVAAEEKVQQKELKGAEKLLAAATIAQEKKEAKAFNAAKVAQMSPEEKQQYKTQVADQKATNKRVKEQKEAQKKQKLDDAAALVRRLRPVQPPDAEAIED